MICDGSVKSGAVGEIGRIGQISRIIVAGNGPSALSAGVKDFPDCEPMFRTNYFYLPERPVLRHRVTDWFICEDLADCRAVLAWIRSRPAFGADELVQIGADSDGSEVEQMRLRMATHLLQALYRAPRIWIPGVDDDRCREICEKHLAGFDVRIQRNYPQLPPACRWQTDLAPQRPLMGSFALAVAVGLQPAELYVCGLDLFQHPSGGTHGGLDHDVRPWQQEFNMQYRANTHRNHTLRGDLKYIRAALEAYQGKLTCVGSVMASYFADDFPQWEWVAG